jgi:hypothetical protein
MKSKRFISSRFPMLAFIIERVERDIGSRVERLIIRHEHAHHLMKKSSGWLMLLPVMSRKPCA